MTRWPRQHCPFGRRQPGRRPGGNAACAAGKGARTGLLVGASAGALNAAFVAGHGFSSDALKRLTRLWLSLRRQDVFPFAPHRDLLALAGARPSICSPDPLAALVREHLPFSQLQDSGLPVHIVATDVLSGRDGLISTGDAVSAVMASAAIPGVFPPVQIGGRAMFDGGIANKTPVSHAVALGAERVVVLPTGYACGLEQPPATALGTLVHALTLLTEQRLIFDIAAYERAVDLVVLPPRCPLRVSPADFGRARDLVARAWRDTGRWLDEGGAKVPQPERLLSMHGHGMEA